MRHSEPTEPVSFKFNPDSVYLLPLGGLGEIGMNLMTLIYRKKAIFIDCGVMFPDSGTLGIDLIIPDCRFLIDQGISVEGIVLTHGHEDHIGAVAFLLRDLKFPKIYGTAFTLALVEDRLRQQGVLSQAELVTMKVGDRKKIADFEVEGIQVTHSVIDSMGLIIRTPVGTILHSGDFKMDPSPIDGKTFDEDRIKEVGREGILLTLSDSTNVERPGWSRPEADVAVGIREVFSKVKKGKLIFAVFASNVHRIQQIILAAEEAGRKVGFLGRSIHGNIEISERLGYLTIPAGLKINAEDVEQMNPENVCLIVTGTQAEPRSALYRMSLNDHPQIKLHPGDTVVFSSRFIPGNEKAISHLINHLYRRQAEVIDSDTAVVHASGHAHQEEQKALLSWAQTRFFLPVHGEYRMLVKHLKLAREVLPKCEGVVAENGELLELTAKSFKKVGRVPHGKIYLDEAAGDLDEETLRDRKQMAFTGLVVVSLVIDHRNAKIKEGPDFDVRGLGDEIDLHALKEELLKKYRELSTEARLDQIELEEELRRGTRRFFKRTTGIKPVVIPMVYAV